MISTSSKLLRSNSKRFTLLSNNSNRSFTLNHQKRSLIGLNLNHNYNHNSNNNNNLNFKRQKVCNYNNQIRFNSITANTDGSIIPESIKNLTDEEYHNYSNETFDQVLDELDKFFEDNKIMEAEVDEEAGVMEINCSEGTYIINKQPPTKQIWLSSPISGPKRFDYYNGSWICLRDGEKLSNLLQNEMNQMYGNFKWSKSF